PGLVPRRRRRTGAAMNASASRKRPLADRLLFAATLALLFWLPLPWGSHTPWASDVLVTAAAGLLGLRLLLMSIGQAHTAHRAGRRLLLPALWWCLWLAWIACHLVPLDEATLVRWSPEAARLYTETAQTLLGTPPV